MKKWEDTLQEQKHQHCNLLGTDAVKYMQWPERLPDGRLFSLMMVGKPDGPFCPAPCSQYLFGRISEDDGQTWQAPYLLYEWQDKETAFEVQGWKSDREGRIHVFTAAITRYDVEHGLDQEVGLEGYIAYLRFDSYRGENPYFSDVPSLYRYTGSLNNVVELESGRLVVPFSTYMPETNNFVSATIYSDDHGDTWQASNDVRIVSKEDNCESGAVEPIVAQVRPGVMVMLIRTVLNRFWYAVSYDDGASWSEAKETNIPSSNAPGTLQMLPDGRIILAWNNCLGQPMQSTRYSAARQCLYAAVSDDGLRTLRGARVFVKKTKGDPNKVLNCYPTTSMDDEHNILLKYIEVDGRIRSSWKHVQGYLVRLDPDFLEMNQVSNCWGDWVCDCPITEAGITLHPTEEQVAHGICNFPYATEGSFLLKTEGDFPEGCRVLLSDCYLDRANYMPGVWEERHKEFAVTADVSLCPEAAGEWVIAWDAKELRLFVNGELKETVEKGCAGYNHLTVVFEGDGELALTHYEMQAKEMAWDTGIVY